MNTEPKSATLIIASGQTVSDAIKLVDFNKANLTIENRYFTPKGIIFPVTTGASFTFEVSEDGTNFVQLRAGDNNAIAIAKTAGSGSAHPLAANDFAGWSFLRVVSDQTEGAARSITLKGYEV